MRFVVDASVATKWLVVEEDADIARELATSGGNPFGRRMLPRQSESVLGRSGSTGAHGVF